MLAYKIFEVKGQDKLMKEVASKLKLINSGKRPDEQVKEDEKGLLSEENKSKGSQSASPSKDVNVPKPKSKKKGKKNK